jgi:hypothetical protein
MDPGFPFIVAPWCRYTQLRDAGEYQCQINTEPKMSYSVFLSVEGMSGQSKSLITNGLCNVIIRPPLIFGPGTR